MDIIIKRTLESRNGAKRVKGKEGLDWGMRS